MLISGHRSEYLVGVEHYQAILVGRAVGSLLMVALVPELNNPHDPNAVAGHVDGKVAGYFGRELAAKYRASLVLANELGFRVFVRTEVQQRDDGLLRPGWLDIPPPDAPANWLALPEEQRNQGLTMQRASRLRPRGHRTSALTKPMDLVVTRVRHFAAFATNSLLHRLGSWRERCPAGSRWRCLLIGSLGLGCGSDVCPFPLFSDEAEELDWS